MFAFTTRNTVRVSLMQVGLIVFGVLAAALSGKALEQAGLPQSVLAVFLADYGALLFMLPLAWALLAIRWKNDPAVGAGLKLTIFLAGLALLTGFAVLGLAGAAGPWWEALATQ